MVDDDPVMLEPEVAKLLKCKPSQVRALGRRGKIVRVPPMRPPRYLRSSVERVLHDPREGHNADDGQSARQAPTQATPPGRGYGGQAQGSLASEAVGGSRALHRRIGPAANDVVVRRVPG